MQPDDILTREIPSVSPEQVALRDDHLHDTYATVIRQQAQAFARAIGHIEALTAERDQLRAKEQAQAARIEGLEAQIADAGKPRVASVPGGSTRHPRDAGVQPLTNNEAAG